MKKILIIGVTSKIAEKFIESVKDVYEIYGTYQSKDFIKKDTVHYLPLDLNDHSSVEELTVLLHAHSFFSVFLFSSTYSKDATSIDEYLLDAEKDLRINALSPIAILKQLHYEPSATVFLFADAGLQTPKKNFSAYSVSKHVLSALGTLLAVELANTARVVTFKLGPTMAPSNTDHAEEYYDRTLHRVDEPVQGLIRYIQFLMNEKNLSMTGTEIVYDGGTYLKR
ncbi:MAG: SDR family oxidoreductase [Candidatus Microsaccharimonas sp.]